MISLDEPFVRNEHTMKTNQVFVSPWQPEWQERFEELRATLQPQLEELAVAIEHIGSTSVAGLAAKPILDVDVIIPTSQSFQKVKTRLEQIGYFHRGDLGVKGRESFGYQDKPDLMRHHLYVLAQDSEELMRHLGFRDWLRSHPEDAAEYSRVKRAAAERFPENIDAYIEAKSDFILQVYQKAGLTSYLKIKMKFKRFRRRRANCCVTCRNIVLFCLIMKSRREIILA